MRGVSPTRRWQAGRQRPGRGAERDPQSGTSHPGGLPIPVPAWHAGEARRDWAGWGSRSLGFPLLTVLPPPSALPWLPPWCSPPPPPPPTRRSRGVVPRPRQVQSRAGWNAGSRAAWGRAPGSPGCFRPGLGGGRGEGGPAGEGGKERSRARPTRLCLLCSQRWQRRGGRGGQRPQFSAPRSPGNSCGSARPTSGGGRGGGGGGKAAAAAAARAHLEPGTAGARLGVLVLRGPAGW